MTERNRAPRIRLVPLEDALAGGLARVPLFKSVQDPSAAPEILRTAIEVLRKCDCIWPEDRANHVYELEYSFGEPIVSGNTVAPPQTSSPRSDTEEDALCHWNGIQKFNPLFVIIDGFVEIHEPCDPIGPSVPIIQLPALQSFGEFEIIPKGVERSDYEADATAGFRTVACPQSFGDDSAWRTTTDIRLVCHGTSECYFSLLKHSLRHLGFDANTRVVAIPFWLVRALCRQVPSFRDTYDLIRHTHQKALLKRRYTVARQREHPVELFDRETLLDCLSNELPTLVPISFFANFREWLKEFHARVAGPKWQDGQVDQSYHGPYLFYVPRPNGCDLAIDLYEEPRSFPFPWPVLTAEMAIRHSQNTIGLVQRAGHATNKPASYEKYQDQLVAGTMEDIARFHGRIALRLHSLTQDSVSDEQLEIFARSIGVAPTKGKRRWNRKTWYIGPQDPVAPWKENWHAWIAHVRGPGEAIRLKWLDHAILEMLGEIKGKSILELGCGEGRLTRILATKASFVAGVDVVPGLIREAEREAKAVGLTKLKYACLDAANLEEVREAPYEWRPFDTVIACLSLNSVADLRGVFEQIKRVSSANGRLLVVLPHPKHIDPSGKTPAAPFNMDIPYYTIIDGNNPFLAVNIFRTIERVRHLAEASELSYVRSEEPRLPEHAYAEMATNVEHIRDRDGLPDPRESSWFVVLEFSMESLS